jgi:hypothetical protein
MKIENLENEQNNIKNLNLNLDQLRLQMEKLNKYIFKEGETKANLERQFELTANDYVERLKVKSKLANRKNSILNSLLF